MVSSCMLFYVFQFGFIGELCLRTFLSAVTEKYPKNTAQGKVPTVLSLRILSPDLRPHTAMGGMAMALSRRGLTAGRGVGRVPTTSGFCLV